MIIRKYSLWCVNRHVVVVDVVLMCNAISSTDHTSFPEMTILFQTAILLATVSLAGR